jgi:transposase InsO family protein
MDKTAWLAARGVAAAWPARGLPGIIHVDNGAEFHAAAFERACEEHGIGLIYRPPGTPRFGGHVERLIGTMMGVVHLLPGSAGGRRRRDLLDHFRSARPRRRSGANDEGDASRASQASVSGRASHRTVGFARAGPAAGAALFSGGGMG